MRQILNQVVEAERRAQANVITRREETAATRSLLNTAKLLDENPTLMRLKELEHAERIAEKIGSLSVVGGIDALVPKIRDALKG
jgi:regulator of protease activity HflC (stomatin/prohibitin superfamily)